jgi:membrane carboxypeptidase/penicillin-binding protein
MQQHDLVSSAAQRAQRVVERLVQPVGQKQRQPAGQVRLREALHSSGKMPAVRLARAQPLQ